MDHESQTVARILALAGRTTDMEETFQAMVQLCYGEGRFRQWGRGPTMKELF